MFGSELKEIILRHPDGTRRVLRPVTGTQFEAGKDIGHEISDEYEVFLFRSDARYGELDSQENVIPSVQTGVSKSNVKIAHLLLAPDL